MLWFYLTTFFIIAKIWGGLTFSWWLIALMVFLDLLQFIVDTTVSESINSEDVEAEELEETEETEEKVEETKEETKE